MVSRGALRATLSGFSAGSDGSAPKQPLFDAPKPGGNPYTNSSQQPGLVNMTNTARPARSGVKKWVIGGVAAAVLVASGFLVIPNLMGGGEKFEVTPHMSENHIARVEPQTAEIMPVAFLEKVDSCNKPSKSYASVKWAKDKESRSCRFVKDLQGAPGSSGYYKNNFDLFSGDTAQQVYEDMKNSEGAKREFQKAKGSKPEVLAVEQDNYTAIVVWYKKENYLLVWDEYAKPTDIEVRDWGSYFGFLKK